VDLDEFPQGMLASLPSEKWMGERGGVSAQPLNDPQKSLRLGRTKKLILRRNFFPVTKSPHLLLLAACMYVQLRVGLLGPWLRKKVGPA
jgi:hypothetical protein